jgi:hypothetical protein
MIKVYANSKLDTLIKNPSDSEESANNQEKYAALPFSSTTIKRSPCLNGGSLIKDGEPCQCLPGYTGSLCGISLDELNDTKLANSREKRFELAILILVLGFIIISIVFIIICCNCCEFKW